MPAVIKSNLRSVFVIIKLSPRRSASFFSGRLTSLSVHRERQEREEAEREGRNIQEEEPEGENMPNPFQPIGSVICEVRAIVRYFRSELKSE